MVRAALQAHSNGIKRLVSSASIMLSHISMTMWHENETKAELHLSHQACGHRLESVLFWGVNEENTIQIK